MLPHHRLADDDDAAADDRLHDAMLDFARYHYTRGRYFNELDDGIILIYFQVVTYMMPTPAMHVQLIF